MDKSATHNPRIKKQANVHKVSVVYDIPSTDSYGSLHFFDEKFGGIMGNAYLCSVKL